MMMDWKSEAIEAGIAEWLSDPARSNEATIRAILDAAVEAQGHDTFCDGCYQCGKIIGRAEAFEEAVNACKTRLIDDVSAQAAKAEFRTVIRALAKEPPK